MGPMSDQSESFPGILYVDSEQETLSVSFRLRTVRLGPWSSGAMAAAA